MKEQPNKNMDKERKNTKVNKCMKRYFNSLIIREIKKKIMLYIFDPLDRQNIYKINNIQDWREKRHS